MSDYFEGMEAPAADARVKSAKSKAKGDSYRPDKLQKALEVVAGVADSVSYKVQSAVFALLSLRLRPCSSMIIGWLPRAFSVNI